MDSSQDHLKKCAARYVWPRRTQLIMHKEPGERYKKRITWAKWFELKFGQEYMSYVQEQISDRDQRRRSESGS